MDGKGIHAIAKLVEVSAKMETLIVPPVNVNAWRAGLEKSVTAENVQMTAVAKEHATVMECVNAKTALLDLIVDVKMDLCVF